MGQVCGKTTSEPAQLLRAAKEGDAESLQKILSRHVKWSTSIQTWNGQSVWHIAARYGQLDVLKSLVESIQFSPSGPEQWQPLLKLGHSTDAIIKSMANHQDMRLQTPLHLACMYGHADCVKFLLGIGATPWAWDELGGRSPLHYAASIGHVDCISALLAEPVHNPGSAIIRAPNKERTRLVDIMNDSGFTPLHYAVWAGNCEAMRALASYDANLTCKNVASGSDWVQCGLKFTPLHLAAFKGNAEAVKLLLAAHVQMTAVLPTSDANNRQRRRDPRRQMNAARQLPYHVALARGHSHLSEILHPDVPYSFILNPEEVEGAARLFGPPKLAIIAASALQKKLQNEILTAMEQSNARELAKKAARLAGGASGVLKANGSGVVAATANGSTGLLAQEALAVPCDGTTTLTNGVVVGAHIRAHVDVLAGVTVSGETTPDHNAAAGNPASSAASVAAAIAAPNGEAVPLLAQRSGTASGRLHLGVVVPDTTTAAAPVSASAAQASTGPAVQSAPSAALSAAASSSYDSHGSMRTASDASAMVSPFARYSQSDAGPPLTFSSLLPTGSNQVLPVMHEERSMDAPGSAPSPAAGLLQQDVDLGAAAAAALVLAPRGAGEGSARSPMSRADTARARSPEPNVVNVGDLRKHSGPPTPTESSAAAGTAVGVTALGVPVSLSARKPSGELTHEASAALDEMLSGRGVSNKRGSLGNKLLRRATSRSAFANLHPSLDVLPLQTAATAQAALGTDVLNDEISALEDSFLEPHSSSAMERDSSASAGSAVRMERAVAAVLGQHLDQPDELVRNFRRLQLTHGVASCNLDTIQKAATMQAQSQSPPQPGNAPPLRSMSPRAPTRLGASGGAAGDDLFEDGSSPPNGEAAAGSFAAAALSTAPAGMSYSPSMPAMRPSSSLLTVGSGSLPPAVGASSDGTAGSMGGKRSSQGAIMSMLGPRKSNDGHALATSASMGAGCLPRRGRMSLNGPAASLQLQPQQHLGLAGHAEGSVSHTGHESFSTTGTHSRSNTGRAASGALDEGEEEEAMMAGLPPSGAVNTSTLGPLPGEPRTPQRKSRDVLPSNDGSVRGANGANAPANALAAALSRVQSGGLARLPHALSVTMMGAGSATCSEVGDNTCGVCFDQPHILCLESCNHRLCASCAKELCKLHHFKPALCPFCRGVIAGFKLASS